MVDSAPRQKAEEASLHHLPGRAHSTRAPIVAQEVAQEKYQHGTRARYVLGKCRCDSCRAANNAYQKARDRKAKQAALELEVRPNPRSFRKHTRVIDGKAVTAIFRRACPGVNGHCPWKSYLRKDSVPVCANCAYRLFRVPATRVLEHLRYLSKQGIGYKTVADAAQVAHAVLRKILSGKIDTIERDAEKRVLAVDLGAMADRASIDGAPTHKMLAEIRSYGLTWEDIGHYVGTSASAAWRISKSPRVFLRTEHKMKKVLEEVRRDYAGAVDEPLYCPQCEKVHPNDICPLDLVHCTKKKYSTPEARQQLLKKIIPPEKLKAMSLHDVQELRESLPNLYGTGSRKKQEAGYRKLHRDLTALGYVSTRMPRKEP